MTIKIPKDKVVLMMPSLKDLNIEEINKSQLDALINDADFELIKIDKNDINIDEMKKIEELNFLKKIAFRMVNSTRENIILNMGNEENFIILSGKEELIAKILSDVDIDITVIKANKKTMDVLGINEDEIEEITTYNTQYSPILSWEINPERLKQTWNNVDFVLTQLQEDNLSREEKRTMIPTELWKDEKFQDKAIIHFLRGDAKKDVPHFVWYQPVIINLMKTERNFFEQIWNDFLKGIIEYENRWNTYKVKFNLLVLEDVAVILNEIIEGKDIRKIDEALKHITQWENLILEKIAELEGLGITTGAVYEQYQNKITLIKEERNSLEERKAELITKDINEDNSKIMEVLFDLCRDKKWVLGMNNIPSLFMILEDDFRGDIDIIEAAIRCRKENYHYNDDYEKYIPENVFKEIDNLAIIYNVHLKCEHYISGKYIEKMVKELNTKERCLNFIEKIEKYPLLSKMEEYRSNTESLENIFKKLSLPIRNNNQIALKFINKKYHVYKLLNNKQKLIQEIAEECIKAEGSNLIPDEIKFKVTDPTLIKKMIMEDNTLMMNEASPIEWKNDFSNFLLLTNVRCFKDLSEEAWGKITSNKVENCIPLLNKNPDIYNTLPTSYKENNQLALNFIENIGYIEGNEIPKKLWGSRSFCLDAIMIKKEMIKHVPSYFWKEHEFMEGFCQYLDVKDYGKEEILKLIPEEIKKYFNAFNIKENYNKFLLTYSLDIKLNENVSIKPTNKRNKI